MSDTDTVEMKSMIGMEMRSPVKFMRIIKLEEFICKKPFFDIEVDEIVFAGYDPSKRGYFISHDRYKDTYIGWDMFYEHFDQHFPLDPQTFMMCSSRQRKALLKDMDSKKYFK